MHEPKAILLIGTNLWLIEALLALAFCQACNVTIETAVIESTTVTREVNMKSAIDMHLHEKQDDEGFEGRSLLPPCQTELLMGKRSL